MPRGGERLYKPGDLVNDNWTVVMYVHPSKYLVTCKCGRSIIQSTANLRGTKQRKPVAKCLQCDIARRHKFTPSQVYGTNEFICYIPHNKKARPYKFTLKCKKCNRIWVTTQTPDKAFCKCTKKRGMKPELITINGVARSKKEWQELAGITRQGYYLRLNSGMSIEEALTKPAYSKMGRPPKRK